MRTSFCVALLLAACGLPKPGGAPPDSGTTATTPTGAPTGTPAGTSDTVDGATPPEVPCGGPCPAGAICVHPALEDTPLTCVDATDVYDDGTEPAKAFVDAGNGWYRKRVTDWEARDARCNDGSPYAYYVSPGRGDGRDKWVIYHKGRGSCADAESCGWRWATDDQSMRQRRTVNPTYDPGDPADIVEGIYGRLEPTNHFGDWTFVHLQYCSSDSWRGTAVAADNPSSLHMRGRAIVEAVVDELLAGVDPTSPAVDLPSLADATQVLVTGASAGGAGARGNMDLIATRLRDAGVDAPVKGHADATIMPAVVPHMYNTGEGRRAYYGAADDADCTAAHPHALQLCGEGVHLASGGGMAAYYGGEDAGHLGVAAVGEDAVDDVFLFMSTQDGGARGGIGLRAQCIRTECTTHDDCGPGQGCTHGMCLTAAPCAPRACTPDDVPCHGLDAEPACIGGVATHESVCDDADDCDDGERCEHGFCAEDRYGPCTEHADCAAGGVCVGGQCLDNPVLGACEDDTYLLDSDLCRGVTECGSAFPCGDGYTCVPWSELPSGQAFQWAIRDELTGLGPRTSTFVPLSGTHTATGSSKYYGKTETDDGYVDAPSLRVHGQTLAEALGSWHREDEPWIEAVAAPSEVRLPLVVAELRDLSVEVAGRTAASGCDDDAVLFLLCGVDDACTEPASAAAVAGVGDTGTLGMLGVPLPAAAALKLVIAPNPTCGGASLALASGDHLAVTVQLDGPAAHVVTRRIALPSAATALDPLTLYVGLDGATWVDAGLASLAARRFE